MFSNYLKIAWRNLTRTPVFSVVNIAGLALGLTCCMLIMLYTKDEVSFDQFQANKQQLYRIVTSTSDERGVSKGGSTNAIHGPSFKQAIPAISEVVRVQAEPFTVRQAGTLLDQTVLFADANFFRVFSFPLLSGRPETVLSGVNSLVLSAKTAERYFGTTDAVGKTLELKVRDRFEPFVVSGVAAEAPENSSIQFEMLAPFAFQERNGPSTEWIGFYMNTFVQLHPNADHRAVAAKLDQVFLNKAAAELAMARQKYDMKGTFHFDLQPFLSIHLDTEYGDHRNGLARASKPAYGYILTGIALFMLLVASINFVNLTVARSLKRAKEIGIRKVVGGQRGQLVYQFLGESFLFAFLAFALALLLTQLVLPAFNELANKQLSLTYLFDTTLIAGYVGLFALTGLLAGLYPAVVLSGFNPIQVLHNRTRLANQGYLTKGLVVFQFALSVLLVVGTLVVYSQFNYLTTKDLGYNDTRLMGFRLGYDTDPKVVDVFRQELARHPNVEQVAARNYGNNFTGAKADGKDLDFGYQRIDDNYLTTLQIPLAQGRGLSSRAYPADPTQSVVINEAFAKAAGWANPLGKQVDFFWKKQKFTVVGVVRDYHFESLRESIKPLLLTQDPGFGLGEIWLKLKPNDIPATIKHVERLYRKLLPLQPFDYEFKDVSNAQLYETEANWARMVALAAVLFVVVSCLGLFGLATFAAESRIKEIGIRKVLGASVTSIATLLTREFVTLVLIAVVLALPIAWYAADQWLQRFPYRTPLSEWFFALTAALVTAVAVLTVSLQSIKAALMNPVKSLRTD